MRQLSSLAVLSLKFNFLNSLGGIARIGSLVHLDLSNNFLTKWAA